MKLFNGIKATTLSLTLAAAAGGVTPVAAQSSSSEETVRERVVVTLPNGRRIVRWVEKPAQQAKPTSAQSSDPFMNQLGAQMQQNRDDIPPELLLWYELYLENDMRADVNEDGRVNGSDYFALVNYINNNGSWSPASDDGGEGDGDQDDGGGTGGGGTGGGGNDGDAGGDGDDDDGGGSDWDAGDSNQTEGWTEFTPSADTIKIHVSEDGDDANDGRTPQTAVRTVSRGKSLLRDGKPDWLLLRAGDTFRESLGGWKKSGRSPSERMLISSYGEGARPKLITGNDEAVQMSNNSTDRHHIAFVGLHFEPGSPGTTKGMVFVSERIEDILIEDCYIANYRVNIVFDVASVNGRMKDIQVRRNVIVDAMGDSHSQGIFSAQVDNLLIEENVIDRNGWDHRAGRSTATIFAHNIYVQRTVTGLVVRDNIIMRGSSHGVQARPGGVVEENTLIRNPVSILFANDGDGAFARATDRVHDNLVLEGVNLDPSNERSWGIHIQDVKQVSVTDNIVANSKAGNPDAGWGISISGKPDDFVDRTIIANNIVDDYGHALFINPDLVRDVEVTDNVFSRSMGNDSLVWLRRDRNPDELVYSGNLYQHTQEDRPFDSGGRLMNLNEWQADYDPQGGALLSPFIDERCDVDDYAQSLGMSNAEEMFNALRQQRKGNWDERLSSDSMRAFFRQAFTLVNQG